MVDHKLFDALPTFHCAVSSVSSVSIKVTSRSKDADSQERDNHYYICTSRYKASEATR